METALLQDLRNANQAITRIVSELSATKPPPLPEWYSGHFDSLTAQVNKIEKVLASVPPPGLRDEELAKELKIYVVNLGLIKKAIEGLGPLLKENMRVTKEAIARLGAARSWSASLKDLSR
jgi:hypothetical protein